MIQHDKKQLAALCTVVIGIVAASCIQLSCKPAKATDLTKALADSISRIASGCPGKIGVALIINGTDTVTVNNESTYPMMSVFKMHQALAVCHDFDRKGLSLDSLMTIGRAQLDPDTWSPMMEDHPEAEWSLSVGELLRYTLMLSDNNASNLMFSQLVDVARTDSFIATIIPRQSFQIACTEGEMKANHDRAQSNYTSPLGAAMLMDRLFTDSLVSNEKQEFVCRTLQECQTGTDRIVAPLLGREGISIAHKTGSGYRNEEGILAAYNDVAHICLPGGVHYTLAIFAKDIRGSEAQAAGYMARISAAVYVLLATVPDAILK